MEQIDGTLLKIIFSVLGFVITALIGVIAWLFMNLQKTIESINAGQAKQLLGLTELKSELSIVKTSIGQEVEFLKEKIESANNKADKNSDKITSISKEVGALTEWRKVIGDKN